MSELKVVETIATCVETDSREVDEKLERESCLKLNVPFVNNNGVHIYIYCNKEAGSREPDTESQTNYNLQPWPSSFASSRYLLLSFSGTGCWTKKHNRYSNFTSESYHLFLESIRDESGIWSFAGNWGVEQVAQGHHLFPKYAQRRSNYSECWSSRIPHQSEKFDCVLLHTWGNESFVGWVLHLRPQPYSISLLPSFPVVEEPWETPKLSISS
jgi:hypothetical protein